MQSEISKRSEVVVPVDSVSSLLCPRSKFVAAEQSSIHGLVWFGLVYCSLQEAGLSPGSSSFVPFGSLFVVAAEQSLIHGTA